MKYNCVALVVTSAVLLWTGCSSQPPSLQSSESEEADAVAAIRNAILLRPDARTQAALTALAPALSAQEWQYLQNMSWAGVTRETAVNDPVIAKGLAVLSRTVLGADSAASASYGGVRLAAERTRTTASALVTGDYYKDAIAQMQQCDPNMLAVCSSPGCVAAMLAGHEIVYACANCPAPPNPVNVDQGTWHCVIEFFANSQSTTTCSLRPYCKLEEITFPDGAAICHDPGSPTPATPSCTGAPSDGADGGSSDVVCFPDTVEQNWSLCANLDQMGLTYTVLYTCAPTAVPGAPGQPLPPTAQCTPFHDADAKIPFAGCDGETAGLSCFCCTNQ